MKRIKVRLYAKHDADLIVLDRSGAIDFNSVARKAIIAHYLNSGEHFNPEDFREISGNVRSGNVYHSVRICDSYAPGIEEWLDRFSGYTNGIVKACMRDYLSFVPMEALIEYCSKKHPAEKKIQDSAEIQEDAVTGKVSVQDNEDEKSGEIQKEEEYAPTKVIAASFNRIREPETQESEEEDDYDPFGTITNMKKAT